MYTLPLSSRYRNPIRKPGHASLRASLGGDKWRIASTRRRPSGGDRRLLHLGLPPDRDTAKQDAALGVRFFAGTIERGVYFCDAGGKLMHHGFSAAHSLADVEAIRAGR